MCFKTSVKAKLVVAELALLSYIFKLSRPDRYRIKG